MTHLTSNRLGLWVGSELEQDDIDMEQDAKPQ